MTHVKPTPSYFDPAAIGRSILKFTPRLIAVGVGAYYGLGFAYHLGVMAWIDQIAIAILKESVGYVGIGALMPTVQWYASLSVRIVAATACEVVYEIAERVALCVYGRLFHKRMAAT